MMSRSQDDDPHGGQDAATSGRAHLRRRPEERFTPALLDVLEDAAVRASFFVLGCALNPRSEQIVARMHAAGHEGLTRIPPVARGCERATIEQEIMRTHQAVEETTYRPTFVRPPYGHGFAAVDEVGKVGNRAMVDWSAWADDWTLPPPPAAMTVHRLSRGHAGLKGVRRGGIVLLHDGCARDRAGESRRETVDAVRVLIPRLRSDGYRMVTVRSRWISARTRAPDYLRRLPGSAGEPGRRCADRFTSCPVYCRDRDRRPGAARQVATKPRGGEGQRLVRLPVGRHEQAEIEEESDAGADDSADEQRPAVPAQIQAAPVATTQSRTGTGSRAPDALLYEL